jgi:hypothetical protein
MCFARGLTKRHVGEIGTKTTDRISVTKTSILIDQTLNEDARILGNLMIISQLIPYFLEMESDLQVSQHSNPPWSHGVTIRKGQ